MPELPEVETIVKDLNKRLTHEIFRDAWTDYPKFIKTGSFAKFKKEIKNLKFESAVRLGKNILIFLKPPKSTARKILLIHPKMTGHLLLGKWKMTKSDGKAKPKSLLLGPISDKINDYVHLIFYLNSGNMLALSDVRKFAKVVLGDEKKIRKSKHLSNIGPEPLEKNFTAKLLKNILSREKRKIKQTLMDPRVIAGIGNIYSDEILWSAKIHPFTKSNSLDLREIKAIYVATKNTLSRAVKMRGTSFSDFRDLSGRRGKFGDSRRVYKRNGEMCLRCSSVIERVKIGGRSAHFCPRCQKINK